MIEIKQDIASDEFFECWKSAYLHLVEMGKNLNLRWFRNSLKPPMLEHISFSLGNQNFYIRLIDVDGRIEGPANYSGLLLIASECKGSACIMPMRKIDNTWKPVISGWGLLDFHSKRLIDPPSMVTDELIEMTDWEIHDFAVQIVRTYLAEQNIKVTDWQSDPGIDPSLWILGENGLEWCIVRATRYPEARAKLPEDWKEKSLSWLEKGQTGYFASVSLCNARNIEDKIYRDGPCFTNFAGLEKLTP